MGQADPQSVLHLDRHSAELVGAHVLERLWRQWGTPHRRACDRLGVRKSGVREHVSIGITTHEVACFQDLEDAAPTVRVHGHSGAGCNMPIEDPDSVVLEDDAVKTGCSDHGV